MPTALDIIKTAAVKIGAIESGESLTAQEASDGLAALNSMLDFWAIDRRFIYQIQQESFTWPSATTSRTIGSGGNFSANRPERIEEGTYFRDSSNNDYPVRVVDDRKTYDALTVKSTQSTYPQILFYDKAYPLGVLYVYPVPSASLTLKLNSWQILQNFTALTTSLSLPRGYQYAIENNLALELESIFQLKAPDEARRAANKSLMTISRHNTMPAIAGTEAVAVLGGGQGYNIYSDG